MTPHESLQAAHLQAAHADWYLGTSSLSRALEDHPDSRSLVIRLLGLPSPEWAACAGLGEVLPQYATPCQRMHSLSQLLERYMARREGTVGWYVLEEDCQTRRVVASTEEGAKPFFCAYREGRLSQFGPEEAPVLTVGLAHMVVDFHLNAWKQYLLDWGPLDPEEKESPTDAQYRAWAQEWSRNLGVTHPGDVELWAWARAIGWIQGEAS